MRLLTGWWQLAGPMHSGAEAEGGRAIGGGRLGAAERWWWQWRWWASRAGGVFGVLRLAGL